MKLYKPLQLEILLGKKMLEFSVGRDLGALKRLTG